MNSIIEAQETLKEEKYNLLIKVAENYLIDGNKEHLLPFVNRTLIKELADYSVNYGRR